MSAATIDRLLIPLRVKYKRSYCGTTGQDHLKLKQLEQKYQSPMDRQRALNMICYPPGF